MKKQPAVAYDEARKFFQEVPQDNEFDLWTRIERKERSDEGKELPVLPIQREHQAEDLAVVLSVASRQQTQETAVIEDSDTTTGKKPKSKKAVETWTIDLIW